MLLNKSSLVRSRSPRKYRGKLSSGHSFSTNPSVLCISFKFSFRMSFSYKHLTLASLDKGWNFFSGEFLQLFLHPRTQQLNLPILHLTTSTKTQDNKEFKQMASPKTAPWRFATPNLTQSPAQPRNGQSHCIGICIIRSWRARDNALREMPFH